MEILPQQAFPTLSIPNPIPLARQKKLFSQQALYKLQTPRIIWNWLCCFTTRIKHPDHNRQSNVGENPQDHLNCGFSFEVADGVKTMDDLARQDNDAIGAAMGAYMTTQSGPFATGGNFAGGILPVVELLEEGGEELEGLLKKCGKGNGGGDEERAFTKSHVEFVHALLRTPSEGSGGFFSYAAFGNFIPETGAGDIIGKESTSSSEKIGDVSPGNYLTIACMLLHPLSGETHT
ncbi:hypothetical protein EAF04_007263 [Stromatinia cepivora]|nr:hypothetical protein EAF04_007263 [Stromatinia cepivora]